MNYDSIEYSNLFPVIFTYLIIIALYVIVFIYFKKHTIRFILFMILLILNFFTMVFVFRDIFSVQMLKRNMYFQFTPNDTSDYNNPYTIYYVAVVLLTGVLFLCSFSIILAVFSYGKITTNDYKSYKMTSSNEIVLNQFMGVYQTYLIYFALFVYFLIFAHSTGPTKKILYNIACILFSFIAISASVYCCIASVHFLKIKKYRKQLYE